MPEIAGLLPARQGHFVFESGHHCASWIDLERLFLRPDAVRPFAVELAERLRRHSIEAVCGPLVEGAYVALMVAERLGVPFSYAERFDDGNRDKLFSVRYRIPGPLEDVVRDRRVAVVNDVVSAGSAVKGTYAHLVECGSVPVALGALAVLGEQAARFAAEAGVALETLVTLPNTIWKPADCPLCAAGEPLTVP